MSTDNTKEPSPTANTSTPIWELVIADMHERHEIGVRTYGVPLQAGNGRNAFRDAYQEHLDQAAYWKQAIIDYDSALQEIERLRNVIEILEEKLIAVRG
jgi:hypothetical protein